jgi:hypothetical protein
MKKNIAVSAFTTCHKGNVRKQNIEPCDDLRITHIEKNPKSCRVPTALHDTLRNLKSMGEQFAYVVVQATTLGAQPQRALIPARDLSILTNTMN